MKKLYVKSLETRETVKEIEVINERQYEGVLRGLLMRIDTEEYYVDDSEFDYLFDDDDSMNDLPFFGLGD